MDNLLPANIFVEILFRLPFKSLLGSKLVCKSWRSRISNPEFVKQHVLTTRNNPSNYLFIAYNKYNNTDQLFVINVNFHDRAISLNLPILPDNLSHVVESCNGLLCLAYHGIEYEELYLWNPVTRQVKGIHSYTIKEKFDVVSFGFGFDHATSDYKAVRIVRNYFVNRVDYFVNRVEVYSLNENCWKEIKADYLEIGGIDYHHKARTVTVNGSLMYWLTRKGRHDRGLAMLSFNVQSQNFSTIQLPDGLSNLWPSDELDFFEFKESVALTYTPRQSYYQPGIEIYTLDDGSCWIKKLTIRSLSFLVGCLKTGEFIGCKFPQQVVLLYDSVSQVVKPIQPTSNEFRAFNYTESLINLN